MADVELAIKIPEELFSKIDDENYQSVISWYDTTLYCAIKDGIVLPKGHGRLIDADTLKKDDEVTEWLSCNTVRTGKMLKSFSELFIKKIDATKTIIEAESEDN